MIEFLFRVLYTRCWNKRLQCVNWWKKFFWHSYENKEKAYTKRLLKWEEIMRLYYRNLLKYKYFSNHYKLIPINLGKQIELENLNLKQQMNFIGILDEDNGATMFFIIEKSEELTFKFSKCCNFWFIWFHYGPYIKWKLERLYIY